MGGRRGGWSGCCLRRPDGTEGFLYLVCGSPEVGCDGLQWLAGAGAGRDGRERCAPLDENCISSRHLRDDAKQRPFGHREDELGGPGVAECDALQVVPDHFMEHPLAGVDHGEKPELLVLTAGRVVVQDAGAVAEQLSRGQRMLKFALVGENFKRLADALKGKAGIAERLDHCRFDQPDERNRPSIPGVVLERRDHRALLHSTPTRNILLVAVRPCAQCGWAHAHQARRSSHGVEPPGKSFVLDGTSPSQVANCLVNNHRSGSIIG